MICNRAYDGRCKNKDCLHNDNHVYIPRECAEKYCWHEMKSMECLSDAKVNKIEKAKLSAWNMAVAQEGEA